MATNEPIEIKMRADAYGHILCTVGSRPPETGGLLLGPSDSDEVTAFWFDERARCSNVTYTPDVDMMNHMLRTVWRPQGLDWKGMVHSHPMDFAALSSGDLRYIQRLLRTSSDMSMFLAALVVPECYAFMMFVVLREEPHIARRARLQLT